MEDNRWECHPMCQCTHDVNNKCDGHCPSDIPDYYERFKKAEEYKNK